MKIDFRKNKINKNKNENIKKITHSHPLTHPSKKYDKWIVYKYPFYTLITNKKYIYSRADNSHIFIKCREKKKASKET